MTTDAVTWGEVAVALRAVEDGVDITTGHLAHCRTFVKVGSVKVPGTISRIREKVNAVGLRHQLIRLHQLGNILTKNALLCFYIVI